MIKMIGCTPATARVAKQVRTRLLQVGALGLIILTSGCSTFLRPTPATLANASFSDAVSAAAKGNPKTLDDVKGAFATLYTSVRNKSNSKDMESWLYRDAIAGGGFAATAGQIASRTGLLNTGIGLAALGLSFESLYRPEETKKTHLAAEEMLTCMQRELSDVDEKSRSLALKSLPSAGAQKAQTAVYDVISLVDSAIFRYRTAILSQATTAPSKEDFLRFAKQYAAEQGASETAVVQAVQSKRLAQAELQKAELNLAALRVQLVNEQPPTDVIRAEQALGAKAKQEIEDADAQLAAAKFLSIGVKLEACVKQFTR